MKLYVVGAGMVPQRDLSVGATDVLRSAECVLYHAFEGADDLFRQLGITRIVNLTPLYQDGAIDSDNYLRMEDAVISRLKAHGNVVLLLLGHPRVGVTLSDTLAARALQDGFEIEFLPGISSFDTMLNDIGLDPLEPGMLMIDSNRLLLYRNKVDPHLHTIIYHICSVGTSRTNFSNPSANNKLEMLSSFLCQYFPAEYPVTLVQSQYTLSPESGSLKRSTVGSIPELAPHISFSSSLYIAAMENNDYDQYFLELLKQGRI